MRTLPFGEILALLEAAARSLRALEFDSAGALLGRAAGHLDTRSLDPGDRMILRTVAGRLRKAAGESPAGVASLVRTIAGFTA